MEDFALSLRRAIRSVSRALTPHSRQALRFLALPYCYFFTVNWKICTASRLKVALDFLYIFFVLRNYPDNYSTCGLYKTERAKWACFFGSNYNPYQKSKLVKLVQPDEYNIVFEDKEVCHLLCLSAGLPVPRALGVLDPLLPPAAQIAALAAKSTCNRLIAKPVTGAGGKGIFLIERTADGLRIRHGNEVLAVDGWRPRERFLVQEFVQQHEDLVAVNPHSVNTVRMLTLLTREGEPLVLQAFARFGRGRSFIDNVSSGGLSVGVDTATGRLRTVAKDARANEFDRHPDSLVAFADRQLPFWPEALALGKRAQSSFRFFRMLGLDIGFTPTGPLIVEINAFPDMGSQEMDCGPLLSDARTHKEFARYDLLINRQQKRLHVGS